MEALYRPVCLIYSLLPIPEIKEILGKYRGEYSSLRIFKHKNRNKEWVDSNRTIILISQELFENLIKAGLHKPIRDPSRPDWDFRIVPYEVRDKNLPRANAKKDFFIPIPGELGLTIRNVENIINDKMEPLINFNVIGKEQFSVKIPQRSRSRTSGKIHGSCFLTFNDEVSEKTAALVKAVIDDTYWGESSYTFHCFWARQNKEPWEN